MNGFLEKERILRTEDVDANTEWKIGNIFIAMQEAGGEQCELHNLGINAMRSQNLAWVITRAHLHLDVTPRLGQKVTLRTWPKPPKHAFFPRYYQFDVDGKPAGCASMLYAQLDLTTRRMAKPWLGGNEELTCDLTPPLPLPGNVPPLTAPVESFSRVARYSDLDINGHVNNARYLDWYCDCYPMEHHQTCRVSDVLIHYDREITPGAEVALALQQQDNRGVLRGDSNGLPCFVISANWMKRE